ncbi:methylamine utilization protein [Sphingomonas sp. KR1UV-12]|uniref:Methylamine utilization protein n=1 Tax=Sphingomonas aurea TaxID=3063994 RepID=A0ABT9EMI1_9SPHN|nr:methylamine utilization protein [Sphingomonas sp. KR1UV-12]MDP1028159.1 methylamine utilization protein [Sphingomonas sp. KR1UV-12]
MIRPAVLFAACLPAMAAAAPVSVTVRGVDGAPLPGAVVTLEVPGAAAPNPNGTYTVEQRDIQFQPHVAIVPVGATVAFPNRDKVRHHVYSFSKPKKFDLKLYGREDTRSVTFDQPGVVALGCNIHDSMSGFVFVTATPFAAQTDAAGRVTFAGVPAGGATLRVWHPSIRAAGNSLSQPTQVAATGLSTTLSLHR